MYILIPEIAQTFTCAPNKANSKNIPHTHTHTAQKKKQNERNTQTVKFARLFAGAFVWCYPSLTLVDFYPFHFANWNVEWRLTCMHTEDIENVTYRKRRLYEVRNENMFSIFMFSFFFFCAIRAGIQHCLVRLWRVSGKFHIGCVECIVGSTNQTVLKLEMQ